MKYQYKKLKERYEHFACPVVRLCVEGKWLDECVADILISEVHVHLTCGYEAGDAVVTLHGITDETDNTFLWEQLKPYVSLGSDVILKMGYPNETEEVFCGYIACVECICAELPSIELTLMDIKGVMMSGTRAAQLKSRNYGDAVKEILGGDRYRELKEKEMFRGMRISDTPDKQNGQEEEMRTIECVSESDYDFVVRAAKKFGYEFFVDCGMVYFRKAQSDDTVLMELKQGEAALSASVLYDIRGIVKETEVRAHDDAKGTLIYASAVQKNKLSYGNRTGRIINQTKKVYMEPCVRSKTDASSRADALLKENLSRFGTLECECIGMPVLKPGYFVHLKGYGIPVDNQFYVTAAEHVLSENGYTTRLIAVAEGMKEV
ncbi:phage late control D family protein [Mediterraneibacter agrestimuris]|uniref:phage late control D family protein n=1 Tax=Mediterraneibacter agrestimuris TaxID=2941333 RepID=UPI00203F3A8B|nr:hypothetical protein [Mediterraneibacter agrestimuris]